MKLSPSFLIGPSSIMESLALGCFCIIAIYSLSERLTIL